MSKQLLVNSLSFLCRLTRNASNATAGNTPVLSANASSMKTATGTKETFLITVIRRGSLSNALSFHVSATLGIYCDTNFFSSEMLCSQTLRSHTFHSRACGNETIYQKDSRADLAFCQSYAKGQTDFNFLISTFTEASNEIQHFPLLTCPPQLRAILLYNKTSAIVSISTPS